MTALIGFFSGLCCHHSWRRIQELGDSRQDRQYIFTQDVDFKNIQPEIPVSWTSKYNLYIYCHWGTL